MKSKEIKPLYGIGPIKFGLSRQAVEDILGEPENSFKEEYEEGIEAEVWEYSELGMELTFSSDDDYGLGLIRFFDNQFRLGPDKLIGEEREIMLKSLKLNGFDDFELDVEVSDEWTQSYYSDKLGIIINVTDNLVDYITIFCEYDDDGNAIWPQ